MRREKPELKRRVMMLMLVFFSFSSSGVGAQDTLQSAPESGIEENRVRSGANSRSGCPGTSETRVNLINLPSPKAAAEIRSDIPLNLLLTQTQLCSHEVRSALSGREGLLNLAVPPSGFSESEIGECILPLQDQICALVAPIEGEAAALWRELPRLETLSVGAGISGRLFSHLAPLVHLKALNLEHAQLEDEDLRHLAPLKHLEVLSLRYTRVGDAGLAHLSGLQNLKTLKLYSTRVGDAGLARLSVLRQLKTLHLDKTLISDQGLRHLTSLVALESLDLSRTRVSNEGLKHLSPLVHLRTLNLRNTWVTEEGVEALRKHLPNCQVDWR